MIKHYNIKVYGRVQGVFFRASSKTKADEMGIRGFVRNERDETVYIEAEGEEENLKKFIDWCGQGPKYAIVERRETNEAEVKDFKTFMVLR